MSAKIIQLMPRPEHCQEQTDFPAIAFLSSVPDFAEVEKGRSDGIDPGADMLNNADRTSSNV